MAQVFHGNYVNSNIRTETHTAGGIIGYLDNNGMTHAMNKSEIYNCYFIGSKLEGKSKIGGIIGDSYQPLLEEYFKSNLVEAQIETEDINSTSFGIGGKKQESKLQQTYVYINSTINGENISEDNDTFAPEYYATLANLKDVNFYSKTIGGNYKYVFDYNTVKNNKYPILLKTYNALNQTGVDLPTENTQGMNDIEAEALPVLTTYSLSANKLNVDLSKVTKGTKLRITAQNQEETVVVDQRTYTFEYDYKTPVTITVENSQNENSIEIKPEEVKQESSLTSQTIAYLEGESLIVNGAKIEGEFVNLSNGRALSKTSEIYNIEEEKWEESKTEGINIVQTEAMEIGVYNNNQIETYATYSKVNGKELEINLKVNNQELTATDGGIEKLGQDKIVDNYNGKQYETILGKDGKLYDLKEAINYPKEFRNEGIKELVVNSNEENKTALVYYENGDVEVFNYVTGAKVYEKKQKRDISLGEYIKEKLNRSTKQEKNVQKSYEKSKNIENKLAENPITEGIEKNAKYITMYNSKTGEHEIFTENTLLALNGEETKSETEKISEQPKEIQEFYTKEKNKIKLETGFYLVIGSIACTGITLIYLKHLVIRRKKKKNKNA